MTRLAAITPALAAALAIGTATFAQESPAPEGARVFFVAPQDGATVSSPVTIEMGIEGMEIVPAGTEAVHSGHHHIFLNRAPFGQGEFGDEELEVAIPADDNHIHFGDGSTSTALEIAPGEHTLQLVLGDHGHIPHDPPVVSEVITITVE